MTKSVNKKENHAVILVIVIIIKALKKTSQGQTDLKTKIWYSGIK